MFAVVDPQQPMYLRKCNQEYDAAVKFVPVVSMHPLPHSCSWQLLLVSYDHKFEIVVSTSEFPKLFVVPFDFSPMVRNAI